MVLADELNAWSLPTCAFIFVTCLSRLGCFVLFLPVVFLVVFSLAVDTGCHFPAPDNSPFITTFAFRHVSPLIVNTMADLAAQLLSTLAIFTKVIKAANALAGSADLVFNVLVCAGPGYIAAGAY
jgi:hypothetical protein